MATGSCILLTRMMRSTKTAGVAMGRTCPLARTLVPAPQLGLEQRRYQTIPRQLSLVQRISRTDFPGRRTSYKIAFETPYVSVGAAPLGPGRGERVLITVCAMVVALRVLDAV